MTGSHGDDNQPQSQQARSLVAGFLKYWNESRRRPPCFVGFAGEVAGDIDSADWPERLRRRFGLGHLSVPPKGAALAVLLLRYTVGDVLKAAGKAGVPADRAIAFPTIFEAGLSAYFFPAPKQAPYGRTLDLHPDYNCERAISEVVHLPMDYRLEHLVKIGRIGTPLPSYPLREVRNVHLTCLQATLGRDDFGEEMPGHVDG